MCRHHIEITHRPCLIAVGGNHLGVFGGICCGLLVEAFLLQVTQLGKVVFDFAYRVQHKHLELIPDEGAALLVCNHVLFVDALLKAGRSGCRGIVLPRVARNVCWSVVWRKVVRIGCWNVVLLKVARIGCRSVVWLKVGRNGC